MGFHGNRILHKMVKNIINLINVTSFVETGTCTGDTTLYMASLMPNLPIFSCEIDLTYYTNSVVRLQSYTNVKIFRESSEQFINRLICENVLGDFPMFFLDAHWYDYWPLLDEVINISKLPKFVILADDFMVPGQPQFEHDNGGGGTPGNTRTKVDNRPCSMVLIGSSLPPDVEVGYPNYDKTAAYGRPNVPHLRGHTLIVRGALKEILDEIKLDSYYSWGNIR